MKKIKTWILTLVVGSVCALCLFNEVEDLGVGEGNKKAIQLGVFTKEENAMEMQKKYGGILFHDEDVYRLYFAILENEDNLDYIKAYLDGKKISYYVKKLNIDVEEKIKVESYEEMMKSATSAKAKLTINKELLEIYEEVI